MDGLFDRILTAQKNLKSQSLFLCDILVDVDCTDSWMYLPYQKIYLSEANVRDKIDTIIRTGGGE